jgi:hypothetical protein
MTMHMSDPLAPARIDADMSRLKFARCGIGHINPLDCVVVVVVIGYGAFVGHVACPCGGVAGAPLTAVCDACAAARAAVRLETVAVAAANAVSRAVTRFAAAC